MTSQSQSSNLFTYLHKIIPSMLTPTSIELEKILPIIKVSLIAAMMYSHFLLQLAFIFLISEKNYKFQPLFPKNILKMIFILLIISSYLLINKIISIITSQRHQSIMKQNQSSKNVRRNVKNRSQEQSSVMNLLPRTSEDNGEKDVKLQDFTLKINNLNQEAQLNVAKVSIRVVDSQDSEDQNQETQQAKMETEENLRDSMHKKSNEKVEDKKEIKALKSCRICLNDNNEIQSKQYISPCMCKGSVEYVHEQCMLEWMNRVYQKNKTKKLRCQICECELKYETDNKLICHNRQQLVYMVSHNKVLIFVCLLFILIGCAGSLALFVKSADYVDGKQQSHKQFYGMIGAGVIILFVTAGWVYKSVIYFMMKRVLFITNVTNYS